MKGGKNCCPNVALILLPLSSKVSHCQLSMTGQDACMLWCAAAHMGVLNGVHRMKPWAGKGPGFKHRAPQLLGVYGWLSTVAKVRLEAEVEHSRAEAGQLQQDLSAVRHEVAAARQGQQAAQQQAAQLAEQVRGRPDGGQGVTAPGGGSPE
ncbi:hypothetical protein HaLaN_04776 [Haematococcus lacustris]|uniref:Uncharacterized protein n=1 Tax=Haematococcus lacustris TaxID=44745 RepID=A0A699YHB6_HAELA|nr:hypothetical protein HaLaN_04776 [Haematococcus lacustris]